MPERALYRLNRVPADYPGAPRWVKLSAIAIAVAVLLFVILLLTRGPGGHGPARHIPSGAGDRHAPLPASAKNESPVGDQARHTPEKDGYG